MILYESASVIHGRPYPLKGKGALYGSLFVHFEPLYHTLRHAQKAGDHYAAKTTKDKDQASKIAFEAALQEQLQKPRLHRQHDSTNSKEGRGTTAGSSTSNGYDKKSISGNGDPSTASKMPFRISPRYVWPDYESLYDQRFYFEYEESIYPKASKTVFGKINAHQAASLGDLSTLKEIAKVNGRNELFKAE